MKEKKIINKGLIIESLRNGIFKVLLVNKDIILCYISGNIRKNFIRILPGDIVKIETSYYDSKKGRIIYRFNKNNKNENKNFYS
uniref:Translation initiation factor IF-1 n=1 Tax=Epipogium aphyllum TaxID=449980 RepID=A0A0B4N4X3_9ASPA|nr:translational initiation factor 1 [Epipogium aphyllum]AII40876.1 translational initiation factor 1 [Epipogium aphyllum]AIS35838.1 translational initiation factor 1 [Epipogium aphyllum]